MVHVDDKETQERRKGDRAWEVCWSTPNQQLDPTDQQLPGVLL